MLPLWLVLTTLPLNLETSDLAIPVETPTVLAFTAPLTAASALELTANTVIKSAKQVTKNSHQSKIKSKPKGKIKSETKSKTQRETKSETKSETKGETQNETQSETQSETQGTAISERMAAGYSQLSEGQYTEAIESFLAARSLIAAATEARDRDLEGELLYGLSEAYFESQQYTEAVPVLESAIAFYSPTAIPDLASSDYVHILIPLFTRLAYSHQFLSNFGSALSYYQPLLTPDLINQQPPATVAALLTNNGTVEAEIGQYADAEATLQQAAELNRQLNNSRDEAAALTALGWVYEQQQRFDEASARYQSAISLYQQANHPSGEIRTLNNLGIVQLNQADLSAAEITLNQALELLNTSIDIPAADSEATAGEISEDRKERAILLDSFGSLYQAKGDFEQAWHHYRQALSISIENTDTIGEIDSLVNLGKLMEAQDQPHVAIFFYKQAIDRIETIRQDLKQLSNAIQKRYTLTVADIYRNLADLLLQQNRTDEAVQIVDLLKLQEVTTYLNSRQASETQTTLLSPSEIALANVFRTLSASLSLAEFRTRTEVTVLAEQSGDSSPESSSSATANPSIETTVIESLQATLKTQPVNTAALYPLILEDRLEIVLITADKAPVHFAQAVTQAELSQVVHAFQNKLKTKTIRPTEEAQQLYSWLIEPLEDILAHEEIENIIYLPDGVLRYIPIAALHDGEQWFVQKYQSHNITAAAIDNLNRPTNDTPRVLAGAFTDASPAHSIQVGQQNYRYDGLPAARREVDNLLELIPDTTALFDQAFTPNNTLGAADNHHIVHLATHANFLPGQPESSFILFGDGSTVNMQEIGQWQLPNVDLVVFSACQTAVSTEGDGKELLGLGFQVQKTGAGAAIAALWSVNDTSTAALMNQFYIALNDGQTKAEALRTAQIKLIESGGFQEPHDWAAFILIGNGL